MTHLLLLSALVILACVLCNKLSSKLGVPTLLALHSAGHVLRLGRGGQDSL